MKYKGKLLEEITKGSLDYVRMLILTAFRTAFPEPNESPWWYSVEEIFSDHLVIRCYGARTSIPNPLMPDEFYRVDFTQNGETFAFTPQPWPVIELTYRPKSNVMMTPVAESVSDIKKKGGKKLVESIQMAVTLNEAEGADNSDGPWRITAIGTTADVVNENNRIYSRNVLQTAVGNIRDHLNESVGQGRLVLLTGESDHPKDKGNRRPLLTETVTNWQTIAFDEATNHILLEGLLLGTSKGKDIRAMMKGGVIPGVSQRGYGVTKLVKQGGKEVEEVTNLLITGYDLTAPNEQSDPEAGITLFESNQNLEEDVDLLEQLKKLLAENPGLITGVTEAQLKDMNESQLKKLEGQIRVALGIGLDANIVESLTEARKAKDELTEIKRKEAVGIAITEATQNLPYGTVGNAAFIKAIQTANPQDAAAVKALVEAKRVEYDGLYAEKQLQSMGFRGVSGVAPVLERETGTPDFARASFELAESVRRVNMTVARDWNKVKTRNEIFAKQILQLFDKRYQRELLAESRMLAEAQETSVMNLPYSVSRLVIEEAFPTLVASGLFDVGIMNQSPELLYFERFVGESGYTNTATAEVTTADLNAWVKLVRGRITPETFVLTNSAVSVTYVENVDYVVNYADGYYKALATITDGQSLKATYDYTAIRNGEMQPIQRAGITLDSMVITAAADRLADRISREAIVFSQSQMGYDVVARVLANLVKQQNRKIDQGLMHLAWSQVHAVPNNEAGVWTRGTSQESYDELVRLLGLAKVKVSGRYYKPDYFLCSDDNAETLSNWDGFTRDGFPDAILNANGFVGGIKGKPVFQSTEFPNGGIVAGNSQLVMYRIFQAMIVKGPYQTTDGDGNLIAADQYYTEQFNATVSPIPEKGSYVTIEEETS